MLMIIIMDVWIGRRPALANRSAANMSTPTMMPLRWVCNWRREMDKEIEIEVDR